MTKMRAYMQEQPASPGFAPPQQHPAASDRQVALCPAPAYWLLCPVEQPYQFTPGPPNAMGCGLCVLGELSAVAKLGVANMKSPVRAHRFRQEAEALTGYFN
jgi:hypothetical protein